MMFDRYYKWLGIPTSEQPPNHYRLLGLTLFESDLDVIEGAADRQMSFVRQYQSGEQAAEAARLLNELASVRICLLKPTMRAAYDEKLRKQLATAESERAVPDGTFEFSHEGPITLRSARKKKPAHSKPGVDPQLLMIGGGFFVVCLLVAGFVLMRGGPSLTPKPSDLGGVDIAKSGTSRPDLSLSKVASTTESPSKEILSKESSQPMELATTVPKIAVTTNPQRDTQTDPKVASALLRPATSYEEPVDITPAGTNTDFGKHAVTRFADWDADGDLDLLVGGGDGVIWLLINSGSGKLGLPKPIEVNGARLQIGHRATTASLADLNGDGKPDLIVAHSDHEVVILENTGTAAAPQLTQPLPLLFVDGTPLALSNGCSGRIGVGDWDGDGDIDIVAGHFEAPITCYRNVGTPHKPRFAEGTSLEIDGKVRSYAHNLHPLLFDVNRDGIVDVIFGLNWGTITFLIASEPLPIKISTDPGSPRIRTIVSPLLASGRSIALREIAGDDATPTIGDLDGDGVLDMVSGGLRGKLWWLRGVSTSTAP